MTPAVTPRLILAADVGGTKTNVALYASDGTGRSGDRALHQASYPSVEFDDLTSVVEAFVRSAKDLDAARVDAACFGLPGPIVDGSCSTSNLPWEVRAARIEERFEFRRVALLNDLEATAHGIASLRGDELESLNPAAVEARGSGPRAVVAAGTGLGMSLIVPAASGWKPVASEGGHVEFAPRSELDVELLRFMWRRHERVSIERLVSGPGLVALYDFLSAEPGGAPNRAVAERIKNDEDEAPAVISRAAMAGQCPVCRRALDSFVELYGSIAGNLALVASATGGVYIAGGIAPKILPELKGGRFMTAFLDKGRLRPLVERTPVHVVLNERTAILGALSYAKMLLTG